MPKKSEKTEEKKEVILEKKKLTQEEYEKNVLELAKKGLSGEKIGEKLRREDVHPNDYKKGISEILKEKNLYVTPELKNTEEKLERIKVHFAKNKGDRRSMREKDRIFSKLRKIKLYLAK